MKRVSLGLGSLLHKAKASSAAGMKQAAAPRIADGKGELPRAVELSKPDILVPIEGYWDDIHHVSVEPRWGSPAVAYLDAAIVTPFKRSGAWGVFDSSGALVREATDFERRDDQFISQIPYMDVRRIDIRKNSRSGFIFGGRLKYEHYGHFIFETLSRLWYIARHGLQGRKVLFQTDIPISHWFEIEFIKSFLEAVGISRQDVVEVYDEAELFHDILIPTPCMQMWAWIYTQTTRKFFHGIGEILTGNIAPRIDDRPVYLSKSAISNKITGFINETEIEYYLAAQGVEIVHPETLALSEQIALFRDRRIILGAAGSAFHTSGFGSSKARQIALCYEPRISPNFALLDIAFGTDIEYYYSKDAIRINSYKNITFSVYCNNPKNTAESLLKKAFGENLTIRGYIGSLHANDAGDQIGNVTSTDELIPVPTPAGFDEEFYLALYPDVADAVKAGTFRSGLHHWQAHGKVEGRLFRAANASDREDLPPQPR